MAKKILCLLLVLVMAGTLLAACGNQNEPKDTTEERKLPMNIMQKTDPSQDDTINILMIGNSFCYYYVEELFGLAQAAGIKMRVCNVYYSGCTLQQHWTWWKAGDAKYEFYTTDENGRVKQENVSLENCMKQQNWDVITLQDGGTYRKLYEADGKTVFENNKLYLTELFELVKTQFPYSKIMWHHTWSAEIGFHTSYGFNVNTVEDQAAYEAKMTELVRLVCDEYDVERINTGEAWPIARESDLVSNLCARKGIDKSSSYTGGPNTGDGYHDGDIGGGQYLNACVWFETITGQSCAGNTYRPSYDLSEDLIAVLQAAAHKAVEQKNAETGK